VSQLEKDIGSDQFPPNEHYFGLVNVSPKPSFNYLKQFLISITFIIKPITFFSFSLEILAIVIQYYKHFIFVNLFEIKYWNIKLVIKEIKKLCSRV